MKRLFLGFFIGILFGIVGALPPFAHAATSQYNQETIEALMRDYYAEVTHPDSPLSDSDKAEYAVDVMDQILLLPPSVFNDVIYHAMADYHHHPENRPAIEQLCKSVLVEKTTDSAADAYRARVREDWNKNSQVSFIQTVLDDAAIAFALTYSFQFGKGAWQGWKSSLSSGSSSGVTRFKAALEAASERLARGKETRKAALKWGGAMGLIHASYQALRTERVNPVRVLGLTQAATPTEATPSGPVLH